jgi:dynein heavy chain 2
LGRYVQRKLAQEDLWKGGFSKVKEALKSGHSICERWVSVCETLTSQFWKRYGPHPWRGDKFAPDSLIQLAGRLVEVNSHDLSRPLAGN